MFGKRAVVVFLALALLVGVGRHMWFSADRKPGIRLVPPEEAAQIWGGDCAYEAVAMVCGPNPCNAQGCTPKQIIVAGAPVKSGYSIRDLIVCDPTIPGCIDCRYRALDMSSICSPQ
jgi:hypothetical protein